MEFKELTTERLRLVEMTDGYIDDYFHILSRDEVTKYIGMPSLTHRDQADGMIQTFKEQFKSEKAIRWGILLSEEEKFIGTVGLSHLSLWGRKAEIGYELHPGYWKRGLITEAVAHVLTYAFEELGLFRVGAVTFPANTPSSRVLEKTGFLREGLLRGYLFQNGENHHAYMYSILRTEFSKRQSRDV
ncbi:MULTISPECIES: GNAT family N-acetyltransferase [Halobacillus]|uniref:GNAT family N-acetyltransferase n=1 Tax=Halobacillus TaxID=45667 RepID=UPI00041E2098|nr:MULTISPECIES: GNAT family N-acetyltransferase [Halobacillus]